MLTKTCGLDSNLSIFYLQNQKLKRGSLLLIPFLQTNGQASMNKNYLLEMRKITKEFPGVLALDNVDFNLRNNEIHALMGENGAGKSTLIKILTGIHHKDSGQTILNGSPINPLKASQAQELGISTIYQELNLIPYLSICENIFIGREPKRLGLIDWKTVETKSKQILKDMGMEDVNVKEPLYKQSVAVQQMVAIARAISIEVKILVMDEPTSSLDEKEVNLLFNVIRKLKKENISVIFITHRIDEVFEICDNATILKDGKLVGEFPVKELTELSLVSSMIGRDAKSLMKSQKSYSTDLQSGETIFKASKISKGVKPKEMDLEIKKGEILGLAGLLGSGRTEFAKIVFGDEIPDAGELEVNGKRVIFKKPKDAIQAGLAFCSEDRKSEGLIPNMSVVDNITLVILPELKKSGVVSKKAQRKIAQRYIEKLGIKTPGLHQMVKNLSGGNQQKVLLARWLCKHPKLIILDEPTRGIDVGAKSEIESLIQDLTVQGISILMISSEMEELIRSCDRMAVLRDGVKVGELVGEDISEKRIMKFIAGEKQEAMA
jgi:monosaccharide-transporting ATPase